MILNGQLFEILSRSSNEDQTIFQIRLNAQHPIYAGHFPNNPVTPGVVEMEMIKELVSEALGKSIALKSMSSAKFLAVLNPEQSPEIAAIISIKSDEENNLRVNAQLADSEQAFLKMTAIYG